MKTEAAPDWRSRSTIKVEECAAILGISRSSAYEAAVRSGEIPTVRIGRRILVPVAGLRRLLGEVAENESSPTVTAAGSTTPDAGGSNASEY